MISPYLCRSPGRVEALRRAAQASPPRLLNGIDYLEVMPGQRRLEVHFVHALALVPAQALGPAQVEIRGGVRVRDPRVTGVAIDGQVMTVEVADAGDFSRYVLRLVASPGAADPPEGIDPALAQIEFSFKADCPSALDCRAEAACAPPVAQGPALDYLARDYASLRRLVLDRLSVLMPQWRERNPADLLVTLAEALAFRGDELSYFQDAVATEAYLGTARRRVSVRRHVRLLDYAFHDGCNARAWVAFEVDAAADGLQLPGCDPVTGLGGTLLLTRSPGLERVVGIEAAQAALDAGAQAFELMQPLTLHTAHNAIGFHTWSDEECCLPEGATRAFLRDRAALPLKLAPGDVLVLEATAGAATGEAADVDPSQRHAVRLRRVQPMRRDPVTGEPYVEVEWAVADALPFALCLSRRIGGVLHADLARATGNVALVDHGVTAPREDALVAVPGGRLPRCALERTMSAPLTQQGRVRVAGGDDELRLIDPAAGAMAALRCDPADASPALDLRSTDDRRRWTPRRDLLASGAEASEFVVEVENDGQAVLRFGDGVQGRRPPAAHALRARVRTGNGTAGNVGAEAIGHVVGPFGGIRRVRNPMSAQGGVEALPLADARLYAPHAFRRQERAVTAEDYAAVMEREPRVQRAVATRRWTGSWHTMFITVDRRGGEGSDAGFEAELLRFIERYRLAGHDVEVDAPRYVALDIELHVCTRPGHLPADVEQRLLDAFSARRLGAVRSGFFHPDRHSFGQPVMLSAVVATAMAVPGVAFVTPTRFQRLGRAAAGEISAGRIALARLEIARLDNDPNAPEHGRLRFDVESAGPP
jgi:hypothetical protein